MSEDSITVDQGTAKKVRTILELTDKYTPVIKLSLGSSTGLIDPMASGGMVVISGQPIRVSGESFVATSGQVRALTSGDVSIIVSGGVIPVSQVSGGFNVSGGFTVSGGIQVSGTVAVSGQVIITSGGTIPVSVVSGAMNISGGVTVSGSVQVSGTVRANISGDYVNITLSGVPIIQFSGSILATPPFHTYSMVSEIASGSAGRYYMGVHNAGGTGTTSGQVVELIEVSMGLMAFGGGVSVKSRFDIVRLSGVVSGSAGGNNAGTVVPYITSNPSSIVSGIIRGTDIDLVSGIGEMGSIDSFIPTMGGSTANTEPSPTISRRYDSVIGQRPTLLSGQSFVLKTVSGAFASYLGSATFRWIEKYP